MMKEKNEISGKNPFRVPENYFNEVNRKIISSTVEAERGSEPVPEAEKVRIFRRLRPFLAAAASVALLVLLSYTAIRIFLPANRTGSMPDISMVEFSDSFLLDVDVTTLEERTDPETMYGGISAVGSADIIDYLLVENIDINEIYELL